jgi:hypothetical protein
VELLKNQKLMIIELNERRRDFKQYVIRSLGKGPQPQSMESYSFVVE